MAKEMELAKELGKVTEWESMTGKELARVTDGVGVGVDWAKGSASGVGLGVGEGPGVGSALKVLWITRRDQLKIGEVVIRILRAAARAPGPSFITLVGIAGQRCEMHALSESRPRTQSHLIHDRVVRQGQSNATIVGNSAGVGLIADDWAAVSGIGRQKMPARGNDCARGDCQSGVDASRVAGRTDLPAGDVNCGITVIVKLDKLIARSIGSARSQLTDHDRWRWRGRRGR